MARGQEPTLTKREECGGWRAGGEWEVDYQYDLSIYRTKYCRRVPAGGGGHGAWGEKCTCTHGGRRPAGPSSSGRHVARWREERNRGKTRGTIWREVRNGGKYEMAGRLVVRNGGKNDMAGSIRYCSHCSRHFVLLPQKNNMNAHSYYFLSYSCRIATDGRMDGWMDGRLLALEYHWFLAPSSKNERSVVPSVVRPSVGVGRIPKIPIMSLPLLFHLGNSYNPVGRPRGSYQNSNSFPCWLFHFSFLLLSLSFSILNSHI